MSSHASQESVRRGGDGVDSERVDPVISNDQIPSTRKMSTAHSGGLVEQNGVVQPLLTDLYQITMAYAYWRSGKQNDAAVFDLYFRKNPFKGEFTIFAGLEECLKFLKNFKFSESDIRYLRSMLPPTTDPEFFSYLKQVDGKCIKVFAIQEGSVVFPKIPLIRVEGPLAIAQMLETTFLNLVNYASLVATNAARFRIAAGNHMKLLEFGLRRAQGPDGGLSASRYCYMGGFDGTSNVLAGKLYDIPIGGTHAHAFITSYVDLSEVHQKLLQKKNGEKEFNMYESTVNWLDKVCSVLGMLREEVNDGELAAFISYAIAFPTSLLCLLDTYDVIRSGLPNFCAVALALNDAGYKALGIRLDSGDLSYLSLQVRRAFKKIADTYDIPWFAELTIVASNDINEDTINSLNTQGHAITCFGIGTHLVTCKNQPALGCVYKLVEINNKPRMKLSEDIEKVTLPGKKTGFRLFGEDGRALVDLLQHDGDNPPKANQRVLCRHPFVESKRAYVSPNRVETLHELYWKDGQVCHHLPPIAELREHTANCIKYLRADHIRALNPTPYKVSVSSSLYEKIHDFWLQCAPIGELK